MAEISDIENLEGEFEDVSKKIDQEEKVEEQKQETSILDTLPEKYRGKKIEDVVKMHQEVEKTLSRQGAELGDVRKLADELLRSQLTKKAEEEKPQEVDFFENPQEAIRNAIDNSPKVKAAEEYALNAQKQLSLQSLAQKHPDYVQINNDPDFQEWVNKSVVKKSLYQAAQNFDVDAADELLSTFKELRAVRQNNIAQVDTKARDQALNAAAVETSGTRETSRKIYRSADLIRLRISDPNRYEAMQDEIYRAYEEGRVR